MLARTESRFQLSGTLRVESPLHVGAGVGRDGIDAVVMRDGEGHPLIPGTTLAGVLREVLTRAAREDAALLGGIALNEGASRLVVHDARVVVKNANRYAALEVRNATSINPELGTASSGLLFSREVVTTGTQFALTIEVETGGRVTERDAVETLSLIEDALLAGLPVGGATTRGLGVVRLQNHTRTRLLNLDTRAGMIAALAGRSDKWDRVKKEAVGRSDSHLLSAVVEWHPTGTIMAGVTGRGAIDVSPQTTEVRRRGEQDIHLVLPGTGIKGALRARAEFIVNALNTDAAREAVTWLFGPRSGSDPWRTPTSALEVTDGPRVGRGVLRVSDVKAKAAFKRTAWNSLRELEQLSRDASATAVDQRALEVRNQLAALNDKTAPQGLRFEILDRVAIDRWLGGAADGLLFTALEPTTSTWEPIVLNLDLFRVPARVRGHVVALLLLVLRDLRRGWIPLGRGTRRGWGDVEVDRMQFTAGGELEEFSALKDLFSGDAADQEPATAKAQELVLKLAAEPTAPSAKEAEL